MLFGDFHQNKIEEITDPKPLDLQVLATIF